MHQYPVILEKESVINLEVLAEELAKQGIEISLIPAWERVLAAYESAKASGKPLPTLLKG